MKKNCRLSTYKNLILQFILISFTVRCVFYGWSFSEIDFSIFNFLRTLMTGLFFDIGVISFFVILYAIYLLLFPNKWIGSIVDKIFTYFFYFLTTLILTFSFFAEFTFWEEFQNRFNFIAVDYLIYTFEVVQNINESYPIPLLLLVVFVLVFIQYYSLRKRNVFKNTYTSKRTSKDRIVLIATLIIPFIKTMNLIISTSIRHKI
jgi:hypothetical protein